MRETEFAGKGLFARKFTKGEFIVNYCGVTKETSNSYNIYVFNIGKPDHTVIDASNYPGACGRYINDIDPAHSQNCFPEKFFTKTKQIGIKFTTNRTVEEDEEFRYDYGLKKTPWRKLHFFAPVVENFKSKEKVVVENKKPHSFVIADNLNQPSDEVPLHVENPLSEKVDVILPSNEVNDNPASNEIDENALSNIVAAKQSLKEFYEKIPSKTLLITSPGMNSTGIFFQMSLLVTRPQMLLRSFLQKRLTRNSP